MEPGPHMVLWQVASEYGPVRLEQRPYVVRNGPEIEVSNVELLLVEVGWHGRHESSRLHLMMRCRCFCIHN